MRTLAAALAMTSLAACATSGAGLLNSNVEETYASAKPPGTVANCAADRMSGSVDVRNDGDHYWVLRNNGYGIPTVRWDFRPDGNGGTLIERRASIRVNVGTGDVRNCL